MKVHPSLRPSLAAAWLLAVIAFGGSARADESKIDQWIDQLDSNQYQVREEATRQLLDAGASAFDALTSAANGDRPEPADRSVWILQRFAESQDVDQQRAALEHLIQLKDRPQIVAEAQSVLADFKNVVAVEAIQKLGGRVEEVPFQAQWPQELRQAVVLNDNWQGGDAGLKYLPDVRDLAAVTIIRTDISREGLEQLQRIESLKKLNLYGTKLEDADKLTLEKAMPGVDIDFRRGALLGIRGDDRGGVRVTVVLPGSAAAAAGIQERDIIQKFNGKPVSSFAALTDEIRTFHPGDKATLEIQRGDQTMHVKVTLGRFENEAPM